MECPECQHKFEAPMLGKIKQLKMVGGNEAVTRQSGSSSNLRNLLFVVGLSIAIIGGLTGFFVNRYANALVLEFDDELERKNFDDIVDSLEPSQVVQLYEEMNIEDGLGEWYEPNYIRYNTQGAILRKVSYGVLGFAGLGMLVLISSFFIKV